MGLVHYVFMIMVVLFLIASLSSCTLTSNVDLKGKELVVEKLKGIHVTTGIGLKVDSSKANLGYVDTIANNELTGDFRYDNFFK